MNEALDKNKLSLLRDIEYHIPKSCGLCKYGKFQNDKFGECTNKENFFVHLKTGRHQGVSIHVCGSCKRFEADDKAVAYLHGFTELSFLYDSQ